MRHGSSKGDGRIKTQSFNLEKEGINHLEYCQQKKVRLLCTKAILFHMADSAEVQGRTVKSANRKRIENTERNLLEFSMNLFIDLITETSLHLP